MSLEFKSISYKTTIQARHPDEVIDWDIHFDIHIKTITKATYYHLTNILRNKGLSSEQDLEKHIQAFIFIRLEYWLKLLLPESAAGPEVLRSLYILFCVPQNKKYFYWFLLETTEFAIRTRWLSMGCLRLCLFTLN